jgi:hypothetical protein
VIPASEYAELTMDSLEVIYPTDKNVDLALIRSDFSLEHYVQNVWPWGNKNLVKVDHIQIGGHMDDWINDGLILFDVIIFGYPPIPTSSRPHLVAVKGEVNAIITPYVGSNHPLFIVSPTTRGGFSGGPVLTQDGWLLGIMTSSLTRDNSIPETGFGAAVTVEPLWNLLCENNIMPGSNGEFWAEIEKTWPQ